MIVATHPNTKEKDFLVLLEKSKRTILDCLQGRKNPTPTDFEEVVFEQMCQAAKGTDLQGTIRRTGIHDFPDIVTNKYFGVEVKMTTKDQWTSTGNSVLESSRVVEVQRIYILFGKFGGKKDVRYRLYQECLPEVSVTHSPRYRIKMDLPIGKTFFDKIGIDYDTLRKDQDAIQKIKKYYRSQLKDGEELWWLQDTEDRDVNPIIKPFRSLSDKEKEKFIAEAMILFPEIFGNNNLTKFERAAAYLTAEYSAVSSSLRDLFTAGGKAGITLNGKTLKVPQIIYRLHLRSRAIEQKIKNLKTDTLIYYWRCDKLEKDRLSQWKKLIDENFSFSKSPVMASDIFDAGLINQ